MNPSHYEEEQGKSTSPTNITYADTPEISNLLIIGESDTSESLMHILISIANFTRIVHVDNCQDAATLLMLENFKVVILDNDSPEVDAISFSRVVRINHPITRIIMISKEESTDFIYSLFNKGSIDAFLPVPIDTLSAYSLILEQQARHEIADALKNIVKQPPKFTPAYFLLHDNTLVSHESDDFEFLGCIISNYSVVRFAFFYESFLSKDETLLSVYISAITLLGQQLFERGMLMQEINFGGISIYFHFHEELQFSFLVNNLTKNNQNKVETLISNIINDLISNTFPLISHQNIIADYHDELIAEIIDSKVAEVFKGKLMKKSQLQDLNLIIFGDSYLKLENIITENFQDIKVKHLISYDNLTNYLKENEIDLLIINPLISEGTSNLPLAIYAKGLSPRIQIIGSIDKYGSDRLLKILKTGAVEFVISHEDNQEVIITWIKRAAEKAYRLKINTKIPLPYNLRFSFDQSEFTRSLLRTHSNSYLRMEIPKLYGIFIIRNNLPFYQKLWSEADDEISIDMDLFAGFLSSLATFSKEMFETSESITGLKFGDTSIIIQSNFEFMFVFFAGNLNPSNFDVTDKHIQTTTFGLYDLISTVEIGDLTGDLLFQIDQLLVELFMKFSSLSTTD